MWPLKEYAARPFYNGMSNDAATVRPTTPANARTSESERAACAGDVYTLAIDTLTGLTIMALPSGAWVYDGRTIDLRAHHTPKA